jgi:hypothetical protein
MQVEELAAGHGAQHTCAAGIGGAARPRDKKRTSMWLTKFLYFTSHNAARFEKLIRGKLFVFAGVDAWA